MLVVALAAMSVDFFKGLRKRWPVMCHSRSSSMEVTAIAVVQEISKVTSSASHWAAARVLATPMLTGLKWLCT